MEAVKDPDNDHEEAFCHLVEQYQTTLLRTCCMYLRDRCAAEDAVQETFLKAYKAMGSFRRECNEKTWLLRIAMNTCHDMQHTGWFRHTDRYVTPELLPEQVLNVPESQHDVMEAISKLPQKLREVVLLYYYQNMTVIEIAQALSINHASVSNRLKRAREKLRIALKGVYFNE